MANLTALGIVTAAVSLTRSHPHTPTLDVLDVVMQGSAGQVLEFGDLAAPASPFGQLIVAAFDRGMTPDEWRMFTAPTADTPLRDACLGVWRDEVLPRFAARYGVTVAG